MKGTRHWRDHSSHHLVNWAFHFCDVVEVFNFFLLLLLPLYQPLAFLCLVLVPQIKIQNSPSKASINLVDSTSARADIAPRDEQNEQNKTAKDLDGKFFSGNFINYMCISLNFATTFGFVDAHNESNNQTFFSEDLFRKFSLKKITEEEKTNHRARLTTEWRHLGRAFDNFSFFMIKFIDPKFHIVMIRH